MRDKLVAFPLIIIMLITLFSLFLGSGELGSGFVSSFNNTEGYSYMYDWNGRAFCHFGNFTEIEPTDEVIKWRTYYEDNLSNEIPDYTYYMLMYNNTSWEWNPTGYFAYFTPDGNSSVTNPIPITSDEFEKFYGTYIEQSSGISVTGDFSTTYGLIILAISMLVVAGIVGLNFFGSGENEKSTGFILTIISLLSLWGVFSVVSLFWLSQFPYGLGAIGYFILTSVYCLGLFMKGTE
jgi:hypothetical protein